MKRDLASNSKDSFKQPNPSKKQPTLDFFIKVQKPVKPQQLRQNQSVKLQHSFQQQSSDKSNSNKTKNSNKSFDINDPNLYILRPLTQQEQQYLITTYLNVHFTYACQQCLKDITNYTKIKIADKIYCVQCAGDVVNSTYLVIKALYDQSLVQFPDHKKGYDEPVWSFKDQLRLIEALQLYGIDSYELIKDHMNTEHTIEDIKAHLQYFFNNFAPQLTQQSLTAKSLITCQLDLNDSEKISAKQQKKTPQSKATNKREKSPSKSSIIQQHNQRTRNLLKIFNYNPKTQQLEYESEPSLFTLLASEMTRQDIRHNSQIMEIIHQRRKYQIIEKQIMDKALKAIIISQNNKKSPQNQNHFDIQSESLADPENSTDQEVLENEYLTEDEKWTLFKCQVIKRYNILRPDESEKLEKYMRRARLTQELKKIQKKGYSELLRMRNNYCEKNGIQKMSIEKFAAELSEETRSNFFNLNEVKKIYQELDKLN